jgi:DNA-binding HxlR family transcriptional regulator
MDAKVMNNPSPAPVIESRIGCIAAAMEIIGNKWTALILRDLTTGPKRFSELEKSLKDGRGATGISPRTLSQRMDDLEAHGIVTKKAYAEVPPRCEYTLTEKGEDLVPILRQMARWGDKYYQRAA